MKKRVVLIAVLLVSSRMWASPDIEFSPGGTSPGYWYYQGTDSTSGTFSFHQQIDIDFVQGAQTDALYQEFVFLPNLTLTGYTTAFPGVGTGFVSSGGNVEIKDGVGTLLLSGTLQSGNFYATFATSTVYPEIAADITVTYVNQAWGSAYLSGISVGDSFDLNLSIQAVANFDQIIKNAGTGQNGFSGSMTTFVPEPATLAILALGGLLLRKRK